MCQDRLSKAPSQEGFACVKSHCLHGDGLWGGGQAHSCLPAASYISPSKSDLKEPTCSDPLKKSLFSRHRFSPTPLSYRNSHCVWNASWKPFVQPSPLPTLPGAAPAPARDAAEHRSQFILPTPAFAWLGLSSTPQRRAKSWLIASHVRSASPTCRGWTGWFLSTAILHPL